MRRLLIQNVHYSLWTIVNIEFGLKFSFKNVKLYKTSQLAIIVKWKYTEKYLFQDTPFENHEDGKKIFGALNSYKTSEN